MPRVAGCGDVRQAVIDAATVLMERYGYKKMTIDDIASEIGIGKATLYGYFENKKEVALAVVDRYYEDLQTMWRKIAASNSSPEEKVSRMILGKVIYLFELAQRQSQSIDDCISQLRPIVLAKRDYYNDMMSAILAEAIEQGCKQGVFICQDIPNTSRSINTCIAGLMPLNLSPRELASRDELITKTEQVTDLILNGIRVDRSPTPKLNP